MRVLFSVIFLIIHARTPLSLFAMPVIPISVASAHSRYNTHEETLVFISVRRNSVADMKLPADVFLLRVLQISRCLSLGNVMVHVDPAFFRTDASFLSISLLLQKRERQREKDEKLKRKKFWISCIPLLFSLRPVFSFHVSSCCLVLCVYRLPYLPSPGFPSVPLPVPSQTLFAWKELFALSWFTSQLLAGFLTSPLLSLRTNVTGVLMFLHSCHEFVVRCYFNFSNRCFRASRGFWLFSQRNFAICTATYNRDIVISFTIRRTNFFVSTKLFASTFICSFRTSVRIILFELIWKI